MISVTIIAWFAGYYEHNVTCQARKVLYLLSVKKKKQTKNRNIMPIMKT